MGIFSSTKDRLVETGAMAYLNSKLLAPYGKATSLRLDSTAKRITIEVELKGEASPLEVEVLDYEITEDKGRFFAKAKKIRTSREWLTILANDKLCDKRFEVPAQVGSLLARTL